MSATPAEMRQDLRSAHIALTGHTLESKMLDRLFSEGWTPQDLRVVARLAAHAVAADTAFRYEGRPSPYCTLEQSLAGRLVKRVVRLAGRLYREELTDTSTRAESIRVALKWAELIVAFADGSMLARLDAQYLREIAAYEALCGEFGPLAFAAGLSLDDVRSRVAEGALDPDPLWALAALRDVRWPQ